MLGENKSIQLHLYPIHSFFLVYFKANLVTSHAITPEGRAKVGKVLSCVRVLVGSGPGCVLQFGWDCPPSAGTLIP